MTAKLVEVETQSEQAKVNEVNTKRLSKTYWRLFILLTVLFVEIIAGSYPNRIIAAVAGVNDTTEMQPIAHEYNCSFCHNIKIAQEPSASNVAIKCISCHSALQPITHKGKITYGEDCLSCHQLHAKTSGLLRAPKEFICQTCHRDYEIRLQSNAHADLQNKNSGSCLTCHSSHNNSINKFLRAAPIENCRSCHNIENSVYNHPVGSPLADERTGGELTCTSTCHDAHGTGQPHLLRLEDSDGLCSQCHQQLELS